VRACFAETTTLGLRLSNVRRQFLSRNSRTVTRDGRGFRVKESRRPSGGNSRKVEMDDIKHIEGGYLARESVRRKTENEDA
jgi:hypothetical protein